MTDTTTTPQTTEQPSFFNTAYDNIKSSINSVATSAKKYLSPSSNQTASGGRRRRKYGGGSFRAYTPSHGISVHASPISGIQTAKAHYVGGRYRRRSKRHSRRHRRRSHRRR